MIKDKRLIYIMDCLDLDLDNYTLDDLLAFFKLDYNFNKEELGITYRMVLKPAR